MKMRRAAATAALLLVGIVPAQAQTACDSTFRPVATFDIREVEVPIGIGTLGDEVWAMASTYSGNGVFRIFGYHYDGEAWEEIPEPPGPGRYTAYDAKVDETGTVWVAGEDIIEGTTEGHLVLRWDGEQWERMDVPLVGREGRLIAIEPVSHTDVWAVGAFEDIETGAERGVIMHYDGSSWSVHSTRRNAWTELYDVSFSSPTEGWVSGSGYRRDKLLRWDGTAWTSTDYPKKEGHDNTIQIGGVESVSPGRAWSTAFVEIGGGPPDARLLKWNGSRWRKVDIPDPRGSEGNYDIDSSAGRVWTVGGRWHNRHWATWAMVNEGSGWDRAGAGAIDDEERLNGVVATPEGRAIAIGSVYVGRQQKLVVSEACST